MSVLPKSEVNYEEEIVRLLQEMESKRLHFNPDLSLVDLTKSVEMTRIELSEVMNSGLERDFNDFVNEYRISHFLQLQQGLPVLGQVYEKLIGVNSLQNTIERVIARYSVGKFQEVH